MGTDKATGRTYVKHGLLTSRGMAMRDHALRTWIYVAALDTDYQGIVRARKLEKKVQIMAFYMTPGVYEGIQKGAASPIITLS